MVFEIEGKVALITGAASGLGLSHAKELLRNGLKGVTLVDIDEVSGKVAMKEITDEFGKDRAMFVKTDVTNKEQFAAAFEKTIEQFGNIDILINNAGILNDTIWEREVSINLNATINGTFLGMEKYLKDHKQGREAVIVNTSSIAGIRGNSAFPVYAGTKFAVLGMTNCWGAPYHYERTQVRVVTICPGVTKTTIFETQNSTYSPAYVGAWMYHIDDVLADSRLSQNTSANMVFEIEGKIALVTGGASGIGLSNAKELLRQGLKGVTLADVNEDFGQEAVEAIESEFEKGKALFVKTDVTNEEDLENAFKKTVENFGNIDILINNAGILKDAIWETEIDINVKGTVLGLILGLEHYLKNYKQGQEAVIINTSSTAGLFGQPSFPVYGATKFAIVGLTKCCGTPFHYERSNVRVVAVCPGATDTPIFRAFSFLLPEYKETTTIPIEKFGSSGQKKEHLSTEIVRIIKFAKNGTIWVVEDSEPAYEFKLPERTNFKGCILNEEN